MSREAQTELSTLDNLPDDIILKIIFELLPFTSIASLSCVSTKYRNLITHDLNSRIFQYLFQLRHDVLQLSPIRMVKLDDGIKKILTQTEDENIQENCTHLIAKIQQIKPNPAFLNELYNYLMAQSKIELHKCLAAVKSKEIICNQSTYRNKIFKNTIWLLNVTVYKDAKSFLKLILGFFIVSLAGSLYVSINSIIPDPSPSNLEVLIFPAINIWQSQLLFIYGNMAAAVKPLIKVRTSIMRVKFVKKRYLRLLRSVTLLQSMGPRCFLGYSL